MGVISLPIMLRYGYSKGLASGIISASGTLGQIIPPSIVLIVLADQMGVSVGDLFAGALIPGLLLATCYGVYVVILAIVRPEKAPALPIEDRKIAPMVLLKRVALVMLPPLLLILIVLGSIFAGLATPTESGALGAAGTIILAASRRRLNMKRLREALEETTKLTAMVMLLLVASTESASPPTNRAKHLPHGFEQVLSQTTFLQHSPHKK